MSRRLPTPRGPYKLTEAVADGYCALIARHMPPAICAAALGLSPATVREWLSRGEVGEEPYAAFVERVRQAEALAVGDLLDNIAVAGEDPRHWKASAHLLALKGIAPETRSVRLNLTGELTGNADRQSEGRDVIENGSDIEDDEVKACKASILRITRDLEAARRSGSHVAIQKYGAQLDEKQAELRAARKRAQAGSAPQNIPEAEFRERLRVAAEQMPEAHLQIVAQEWLRRHRLKAVPIAGGNDNDTDGG